MLKRSISLFVLLGMAQSLYAKDLGIIGQVWHIQEQNLLDLIQERLQEQFGGKSEEEIKAEVIKRVTENSLRPEPVELKRADENSEREFDPSYIVERDLSDHKGQVFARKGQIVNPFDVAPFNQTLIFLDGDDEKQVEWLKSFKSETEITKIILTKGNVKDAGEILDEAIYFDQKGSLVKRFGIKKVPSVVDRWPGKKLLRIREFGV